LLIAIIEPGSSGVGSKGQWLCYSWQSRQFQHKRFESHHQQ